MMTVDEIFQSDIQSNRINTDGLRKRCEGHKKTQMRRRKKIQKGKRKISPPTVTPLTKRVEIYR